MCWFLASSGSVNSVLACIRSTTLRVAGGEPCLTVLQLQTNALTAACGMHDVWLKQLRDCTGRSGLAPRELLRVWLITSRLHACRSCRQRLGEHNARRSAAWPAHIQAAYLQVRAPLTADLGAAIWHAGMQRTAAPQSHALPQLRCPYCVLWLLPTARMCMSAGEEMDRRLMRTSQPHPHTPDRMPSALPSSASLSASQAAPCSMEATRSWI